MEQRAGAQISRKAFFQSAGILFGMMILAGILTRIIPPGQYTRLLSGERLVIDPGSFRYLSRPEFPIWRWFTAPVEVLWGEDSLLVLVISAFILLIGGAFAVLEKTDILRTGLGWIVRRFDGRRYLLLAVISLFFMVLGAFLGIFEEIIPLVPLALALAHYLGWDPLIGLGMSILAANLGFSAAITNPFTIGVAQELAGLPLFSGTWLRIPIFLTTYGVLLFFLLRYAKRIDRDPQHSLVQDQEIPSGPPDWKLAGEEGGSLGRRMRRAAAWFLGSLVLILAVLVAAPFSPVLADLALPAVGLFFLIGGLGAGLLSPTPTGEVFSALREGIQGMAPAILLILMAVSVKHIVVQGKILDTILQAAAEPLTRAGPWGSALLIYFIALVIEFFISSGSAKAFLIMPILLPLADLVGVTRQVAVTAYTFGDGFSNTIYPTSPVLLIALGLSVVSYPRWLRWTLPLWGMMLLVTILYLSLAVAVGYGPY